MVKRRASLVASATELDHKRDVTRDRAEREVERRTAFTVSNWKKK